MRAICTRVVIKENPRYRQTKDEMQNGHLCISFDYKTTREPDKEEGQVTCVVVRDRWNGVTSAHVVKGKGFVDDIARQFANDVDPLCYPEFRLNAETGSSIRAFLT